jgi:hypothetical protein
MYPASDQSAAFGDKALMRSAPRCRYYNEERPHGAIGNKVPIMLTKSGGVNSPSPRAKPQNSAFGRSKVGDRIINLRTLAKGGGESGLRSNATPGVSVFCRSPEVSCPAPARSVNTSIARHLHSRTRFSPGMCNPCFVGRAFIFASSKPAAAHSPGACAGAVQGHASTNRT